MTQWLEPTEVDIPYDLQKYVGGHPLLAKVLVQRGITSPSEAGGFLDHRVYRPAPATDLPNLELAAERIFVAIRKRESICVWGDFDVDGQTATTLLVSTLRDLEANVGYHIPVRGWESHGIKLEILKEVLASGVQMILTCDTGIAEHEAIEYAQANGVDVVVTDHHTLPPSLPGAYALVNPQMLESDHPLRDLPGVGVAYKLAEELYRRAGRAGDAEKLLDLVALGIVADVAMQRRDTRYLLQKGLEVLRESDRLGLRALFKLAELNQSQLTEEHIGFSIGPRLNALGRLGDANAIVEFLTTKDLAVAQVVAQQLESLNAQRKMLTTQIYQAALGQIEADPELLDNAALVLSHPKWEAGVIGIVAGRLAEQFNRPVVLLVEGNGDKQIARGSARSVEGVNITEAIAAQSRLLISFGGHPMAGGVSLEADRIPAFRRALSETVSQMRGAREEEILRLDGFLSLAELSLGLVEGISRLAPFGAGNPPLILATRNLALKDVSVIGRTKEHLQLFIEDEMGDVQKVFWWRAVSQSTAIESLLPEGKFDLAYTVRMSDFRGEQQLQVEWVDFRPVEADAIEVSVPIPSKVSFLDYRQEPDPVGVVRTFQSRGIQVWAEGEFAKEIGGVDRLNLVPATELAIWTYPSERLTFQQVLDCVQPEKIYIIGNDSTEHSPEIFLRRLAGLIKFALRAYDGRISLERLASSTAQRKDTIRAGLEFLVAKGMFTIYWERDEMVVAVEGGAAVPASAFEAQVRNHLAETQAFRTFLAKLPIDKFADFLCEK